MMMVPLPFVMLVILRVSRTSRATSGFKLNKAIPLPNERQKDLLPSRCEEEVFPSRTLSSVGAQWLLEVERRGRGLRVQLDQCAWGAPSMKPTLLLVSHSHFEALCPRNHVHEVLKGKVYSKQFNKVVYRTKLAQEYPLDLCAAMATAIATLHQDPLRHFKLTFQLPSLDKRKRPVGQAVPDPQHRQFRPATLAIASGYEARRSQTVARRGDAPW